MWKYSSRVISVAAGGCIVFAAGYLLGAKTTGGSAKNRPEAVAVSDWAASGVKWQEWSEWVKTNIEEREAIVCGLREIAEDATRDEEERIFAIIQMGRTKSDEAGLFLLSNIDLWIRKYIFGDDEGGDESKQQPCFYALRQMGWQVIPHALEFVEDKRSPQEIQMVAQLLEDICGRKVARTILEERMNKLAGDPAKAQALANINQILGDMSRVKEPPK